MKYAVWTLIVLLILLHQDVWLWEDATLVLGFLPVGLAYHVVLSVAASITWYLATVYCWPEPEDAPALTRDQSPSASTTAGDER